MIIIPYVYYIYYYYTHVCYLFIIWLSRPECVSMASTVPDTD